MADYHEKIGDLRIERGLTKKQVSEDLGIPASQHTRIENEDIKRTFPQGIDYIAVR